MKKRLLTVLLSFVLLLSLAPAALAEEGGLIPLETPENLTWGSGSTEAGQGDNFGMMCWAANAAGTQNVFRINCYKVGETDPVLSVQSNYGNDLSGPYRSEDFIANSDTLTSGTYYFTVTSLGDGTQYSDSPAATSETWNYTKPSNQIAAVEGLSWAWPNAQWTKPSSTDHIGGYEVAFYFSQTKDADPEAIGWVRSYNNVADYVQEQIIDSYVQENGDGYYYFKVRALSIDITQYVNGEWSELSPAYVSGDVIETVQDSLADILESSEGATASSIKESVQNLNTEELRTSMLMDQGNNETVELIRQLEEKAGGPAAVQAEEGFEKLDTSLVSITGASLNTSGENHATLNIGPAKDEHDILPTQLDNTVAVSFSMELDGVANTKELQVPVKITLPIPATINPQFLIILHYHYDTEEPEQIRPYVYQQGGQYYASFVLTSFSDFVMTQTVQISPPIVTPDDPSTLPFPDFPFYFPSIGTITTAPQQPAEHETPEEASRTEAPTVPEPPVQPEPPATPVPVFTDVALSAWYSGAVSYASANGLMTGTSDTEFSPEANMTRAMLWTVLARLDGADVDNSGSVWYAKAQMWSMERGISDGLNAEKNISRQELVTMLWRYLGSPAASGSLAGFPDASSVSEYAVEAMVWATDAGIISGTNQGLLNPTGAATRAEVAAILMRFCETVRQ